MLLLLCLLSSMEAAPAAGEDGAGLHLGINALAFVDSAGQTVKRRLEVSLFTKRQLWNLKYGPMVMILELMIRTLLGELVGGRGTGGGQDYHRFAPHRRHHHHLPSRASGWVYRPRRQPSLPRHGKLGTQDIYCRMKSRPRWGSAGTACWRPQPAGRGRTGRRWRSPACRVNPPGSGTTRRN